MLVTFINTFLGLIMILRFGYKLNSCIIKSWHKLVHISECQFPRSFKYTKSTVKKIFFNLYKGLLPTLPGIGESVSALLYGSMFIYVISLIIHFIIYLPIEIINFISDHKYCNNELETIHNCFFKFNGNLINLDNIINDKLKYLSWVTILFIIFLLLIVGVFVDIYYEYKHDKSNQNHKRGDN